MINFRGEIPYIEYESKDLIDVKNFKGTGKKADIRDYKPYNTGFIQVSRFRLSVAIAKSIFSKMPNKTLKRKLAYSYFIQLSLILTSIDDKIYIDYDTMKLFRDFSKNCRDGEIAQGISYILAKDVLRVPLVEDFKYYCYRIKKFKTIGHKRTPDYVLAYSNGSVGILEAKGLMGPNPTGSLIDGMGQCNSVDSYLNSNGITPSNKYVSAVTFATSKNRHRSTAIHFLDPRSDIIDQKLTSEYIQGSTYREYAKYLYMAGDDELDKLVHMDDIQPEEGIEVYRKYFYDMNKNENNYRVIISDETNKAYELIRMVRKFYIPIFEDKKYEVEFGLTRDAINYISREFDSFYKTDSIYGTFDCGAGEFEIFPDGTYMSILCVR